METYTRKSRIQSLKAELELRQQTCAALKQEFEKCLLSNDEQSALFRRWEETLKESLLMQALLKLLEREEKQAARNDPTPRGFQNAQHVSTFTWFYHAKR